MEPNLFYSRPMRYIRVNRFCSAQIWPKPRSPDFMIDLREDGAVCGDISLRDGGCIPLPDDLTIPELGGENGPVRTRCRALRLIPPNTQAPLTSPKDASAAPTAQDHAALQAK
jgi:hypothetical protein